MQSDKTKKQTHKNGARILTALHFTVSFSIFARAALITARLNFVLTIIRRWWERVSLYVGEWRDLSLPGTVRALVLGMRVRTMPFPSIKGPCFHPARSGDRSFGLVSNAGAMTLPHFAVQIAIHSTLPSDTRCVCTAGEMHRGGLLCNLQSLQWPFESELDADRI